MDGTKGDLTETETEINEALSEWEEGRFCFFDQHVAVIFLRKRRQQHGWTCSQPHKISVRSTAEQFDVVSSCR